MPFFAYRVDRVRILFVWAIEIALFCLVNKLPSTKNDLMYHYQLAVIASMCFTVLFEIILCKLSKKDIGVDRRTLKYHLSPILLEITFIGLTVYASVKDPIFFKGEKWWQLLLNILTVLELAVYMVCYPFWCISIFCSK